jgi:NDP-sugar pyrophosphorylase family protein
MLEEPRRLYAMTSTAYWLDIGTPEKYLQAHADVLAGVLGGTPAPGARETAPGVWAQGDTRVDPDARLEAPVLLGDGTVVDAGARVAGSVVGAHATVGAGARVLRAVVHDGATLETDAEIIDSVLGPDATIGVGAIASDHTVVGMGAALDAGARASGARIRRADDASEPSSAE